MRLYPEWVIYSNFFLVAHRGYISIQDLNVEDYDIMVEEKEQPPKKSGWNIFCCEGNGICDSGDIDITDRIDYDFKSVNTGE